VGGGTRIPICAPAILVELADHFLQVRLREPRVDRRRLNVGVPEVLLHRAEIPATEPEQLDARRVAERVRVQLGDARSLADGPW